MEVFFSERILVNRWELMCENWQLQVPPLRYAPVGMTSLMLRSLSKSICLGNTATLKLVIPRVCDLIAFLKISTLKPINLQLDIF
jgi:hypothetical protein